VRIFCLDLPREELYQRINRRVEGMFRQGLIREVKKLLKAGLSRTAQYAIGIAEIKEYLEARCSLAAARELIKRRSRQYAKRQLSWFRNDKRIQWLQLGKAESAQAIAQRIIRAKEYDGTRVTGNY
jgi:tRNA dimethylallyltransferase